MPWYVPCFTLTFVAAVWLECQFDIAFQRAWFLPALFLICAAFYAACRHLSRNKQILCLLLGCCAGFSYSGLFAGMLQKPLASLEGETTTIQATVSGYAELYEDAQRVPLEIHTKASGISFWAPWFHTMAYVPLTEAPLEPGDQIQAKVSFYQGSDSGGFDRATYYTGQGIYILASCENPQKFSVQKPDAIAWHLRPLVWSQALKHRLNFFLNDSDAAFLQALLFGDKADLSLSTEQDFQKAGLSHVMAVSGMHVGFLVMFFIRILGRRFGMLAALAALLIFVPMAGASPSVIRAAIMYAFMAMGFFLRREYSALHSLCAALLLLLLYNPYAIHSLSLQLSFLATLGLILFSGKLQSRLLAPLQKKDLPRLCKKGLHVIASALACSICASIFTAPILLSTFGYVSVASILANSLALGVFAILFLAGFLVCLLGGIPVLGAALVAVIHGLCGYVFALAKFVGNISMLLLYWDFWYVKLGVLLLYIILIAAWLAKKHVRFPYAAALACTVFLLTIGANADALARKYEVQLFSSGSGQCIAVSYGQKHLSVVDCAAYGFESAAQKLVQYMGWNGLSAVDTVVITSLDKTHARDLPELLQTVPVRQLVIPPESRESELSAEIFAIAKEQDIPITTWSAEGERPLGDTRSGISVIGGVSRKLGVRIAQGGQEFLTLHSFTPRMAEELLSKQPLSCKQVILSDSFCEEAPESLIQQLQPKQIYLPSEYIDSGQYGGIPIQTTKETGDLLFREILPRGGVAYGS